MIDTEVEVIPANTMNDGNWRLSEDLTILFSHVRPYHFVVYTHYVTGGSDLDWSVYRDNIPTEAGKRYKLFYRALALVQNIFTLPPTQIEANVIVSLMKGTQVVHIEEIPADQSDELQEIQFTGDGSLYYLKITIEPPPDLAEMRAVFATSGFKMVELVRDTVEINFAGPNEYLYQGKKELEGTDFYDFHARNYHSALGRFMSVDPVYNGPSGYVGMLNNPVSTIDPNGEEPISITTALIIAASVSAASYTASVALSDGGFNNWDWGQFGKSVFIGTASGAVTFGIGTYFNGVAEVGKISNTLVEAGRLATHATFQGGLSAVRGGDFWSAFASGAAGSLVGLGTEGLNGTGGDLATIGSAMLLGGITADATGGDFWKGAAQAGIVAGANHVAHRASETPEEKLAGKIRRAQRRASQQSGGQTWYYMNRDNGSPHGMVYDPTGGFIYEVNGVPGEDAWYQQLERLIINGVPSNNVKAKISVAYQYKRGSEDWSRLWAREDGNTFSLTPVTVTDPSAATAWFQGQTGNPWNYYLGANNCTHFCATGLNAGGAGINFWGPLPSSFPGTPTMTWTAGQPYPVPIGK